MSSHYDAVLLEFFSLLGTLWVPCTVADCKRTIQNKLRFGPTETRGQSTCTSNAIPGLKPPGAQRAHGRACMLCTEVPLSGIWVAATWVFFFFFSCGGEDKVTSLHWKLLNKTLSFIVVPFISTLFFNFSTRTHQRSGMRRKGKHISVLLILFSKKKKYYCGCTAMYWLICVRINVNVKWEDFYIQALFLCLLTSECICIPTLWIQTNFFFLFGYLPVLKKEIDTSVNV